MKKNLLILLTILACAIAGYAQMSGDSINEDTNICNQDEYVCKRCNGSGTDPLTYNCSHCRGRKVISEIVDCDRCNGAGSIKDRYGDDIVCPKCDGAKKEIKEYTCPECHGTGDETKPCSNCGGRGTVSR